MDLARARAHPCSFIEYAIPHERTHKPVTCTPFHWEWQDACSEAKNTVIMAPIEHAKTQQIAVGRLIWELGRDTSLRCALISNTAGQAEKILGSVGTHIATNQAVKEVYPNLRPGRGSWNRVSITLERDTIAKEASVQACGIGGPINGARIDIAILDDVCDFENTRSSAQRQKLIEWFDSTLARRITEGGKIWVIGTPWEDTDLLHELAKRPAFRFYRYSAVENPMDTPDKWVPTWMSKERLIEAYDNTPPHNFSRKYLCRISSDDTSRFQKSWIDLCLALGRGRNFMDRAPVTPGGRRLPCFTAVDVGVGRNDNNDLTCIFTIAIDERGRRIVLDIQSGRWQGPDILRRIQDTARRFDSMVTVENNGAQDFLIQFGGAQGMGLRPHTTGAGNKFDEAFGVESLAVEFRAGLWVIPSGPLGGSPPLEVKQWISELQQYHPSSHAGDRLMASWIAREAARQTGAGIMQRIPDLQRR